MKLAAFILFTGIIIFFVYILLGLKNKSLSRYKILLMLSGLIILMGLFVLKYHKRITSLLRSSTVFVNIQREVYQPCNCNGLQIEKDAYSKHRQLAISVSDNRFLKNNDARINFIKSKHLVDVENNKGYTVAPLEHSSRHLTQLSYDRLIELGKRFNDEMELHTSSNAKFVVSSLSRTEDNEQNDLRKFEKNATIGKSSHSYGVSFDISDIITSGNCSDARKILEQILTTMQEENKILICPESNCVHVTVIK
jgi:hypothetical protein